LQDISTQLKKDDFLAQRVAIKNKIHKFQDFKSSKRVEEFIKNKFLE